MRNRAFASILFTAILASPLMAAPQVSGAASGSKVAVINIQQAILSSAEGKKAFQDLQAKYVPQQQEISHRQDEIQQLQDKIQKQMTTVSADEERRMDRELQDKQKILKRMTEDAQSDFQNDRDDIMRRIGQKMVKVIDQYASKNGYALVIDGSQVPVYYAGKGVDITSQVVKLYDTANPAQQASTDPGSAGKSSTAAKSSTAKH